MILAETPNFQPSVLSLVKKKFFFLAGKLYWMCHKIFNMSKESFGF